MPNEFTVTVLGTGTSQGVPVIGCQCEVCQSKNPKDKRLRSSVMIEWDNHRYIIDCGPDFRQQMLRHKVDKIDGILFTHEHTDHIIGLDDIRPFYFRQGDISIYASERVLAALKNRFAYIFQTINKYPGAPSVDVHRLNGAPFALNQQTVTPINVLHGKLPVLGYRFGDLTYITDAKTISEVEIEKIKGTKVLIINALRIKAHHSHFNLDEALEFVAKVQPQDAYFTHISHLLGFHDAVEEDLPDHIHLAYDNLKIDL